MTTPLGSIWYTWRIDVEGAALCQPAGLDGIVFFKHYSNQSTLFPKDTGIIMNNP